MPQNPSGKPRTGSNLDQDTEDMMFRFVRLEQLRAFEFLDSFESEERQVFLKEFEQFMCAYAHMFSRSGKYPYIKRVPKITSNR